MVPGLQQSWSTSIKDSRVGLERPAVAAGWVASKPGAYIYTNIYIYTYTPICIYIHTYTHIYTHIYTYLYVYVSYTHIYIYMYMYIYKYLYMYIYTYVDIFRVWASFDELWAT